MPVPAAYSEITLASLMHSTLGATAEALGYAAPSGSAGVYTEAVYDALILYGVTNAVNATDIPKLRTAAAVAAWRKATNDAAAKTQFSGDGQAFSDNQIWEHATKMLAAAETDLVRRGGGTVVRVTRIRSSADPYATMAEIERTL